MKRVKWLQDFFNDLQRNKTFRSSEVFQVFISVEEKTKFENMKKQIRKLPAFNNLAEVRLLTGEFAVDLSTHKMKLANNMQEYVRLIQKLYKELAESINVTANTMLILSDALAKNSDVMKDLGTVNTDIEVYSSLYSHSVLNLLISLIL
jgi:lysophospholipase L1-like esterase